MSTVAFMLRAIAWLMLPFAALMCLGPMLEMLFMFLFDVLQIGDTHMVNPTPAERFPRIAREILINCCFLSVPFVLWVFADLAKNSANAAGQDAASDRSRD